MSIIIKGIDLPKDVHGKLVLDDIRLIFSNANTRFSIPLDKDDIAQIDRDNITVVNIKEFDKNLDLNIDPYEIPGALEALYKAEV